MKTKKGTLLFFLLHCVCEAATCRQVTMSSRFRLLVNADKIRKLIRRVRSKPSNFGSPCGQVISYQRDIGFEQG